MELVRLQALPSACLLPFQFFDPLLVIGERSGHAADEAMDSGEAVLGLLPVLVERGLNAIDFLIEQIDTLSRRFSTPSIFSCTAANSWCISVKSFCTIRASFSISDSFSIWVYYTSKFEDNLNSMGKRKSYKRKSEFKNEEEMHDI